MCVLSPYRGLSLNSRHSGAFTSHYFLRSREKAGAFAVLTIELTRGGKVPQIHFENKLPIVSCAFREQWPRICAHHWVIFVHGHWLTLHTPETFLTYIPVENRIFVRPNTLRIHSRIAIRSCEKTTITFDAKYLSFKNNNVFMHLLIFISNE